MAIYAALLLFLLWVSAVAAQGTEPTVPPDPVVRDGGSPLPVSPDSVSEKLSERREKVDSILGPGPFDPAHRHWDRGIDWLQDRVGLDLGMNYTSVYQHATRARGERNAAAGDLDIFGSWKLVDFDGSWPGKLVFSAEGRHRLATAIPPAELGPRVGSLWPTVVGFGVQDPSLVEFYWDQGSYEDGFQFRLGKQDPAIFLDVGRYASANVAFLNAAFSDTPAMPLPAPGLGLAAVLYPTDNFYIGGALQDRTGDRSGVGVESIEEGELFYAVEVGLTPGWGEPGEGLYHVTGWYADASSTPNAASAGGVAVTLEHELGSKGNVVPFLRYSWASAATPVEQLLAVGVGFEEVFGQNFDLIGLGLSWGQPRDVSRRDQYVLETFYRFHITEYTHLTPDIQLIVNPSNAPDSHTAWIFGLRLRTLF